MLKLNILYFCLLLFQFNENIKVMCLFKYACYKYLFQFYLSIKYKFKMNIILRHLRNVQCTLVVIELFDRILFHHGSPKL